MPRIPKVLAGGLTAVMLTAAIGGAAYAQSAPAATPTGGPPAQVQQRAQEFLNSLAGKLGKTPAEVLSAFKSVEHDQVAQAVKDGKLTQQQADQANQRIDQATGIPFGGPGFARGGDHGRGPGGPGGPGMMAVGPNELATFLGIQPQDLRTTLQGKSLAQVAQEKGRTRDQLKAFLTQQEKTRLDQGVQNGRLTQAQADERLANFNSQLDQMIDRTGPPAGGPSGGHGRGGFGRGDRGPDA